MGFLSLHAAAVVLLFAFLLPDAGLSQSQLICFHMLSTEFKDLYQFMKKKKKMRKNLCLSQRLSWFLFFLVFLKLLLCV